MKENNTFLKTFGKILIKIDERMKNVNIKEKMFTCFI